MFGLPSLYVAGVILPAVTDLTTVKASELILFKVATTFTVTPLTCLGIVILYFPSLPTLPFPSSVVPTLTEISAFGSAVPIACVESVVSSLIVV